MIAREFLGGSVNEQLYRLNKRPSNLRAAAAMQIARIKL
jgi:hypothetical protein